MLYNLMRKDKVLALCNIEDNGIMTKAKAIADAKYLPLAYQYQPNGITKWWHERSIPLTRNNLEKMLKEKNLLDARGYLFNNLGLSLVDYYWVKPVDSNYTWKQVNLFENDFKDDMHVSKKNINNEYNFSPNSSLQGDLEKTWLIMNGKRVLVKANHNDSSQESINEVIASKFHELQGYKNYVKYELLELKNTEYKYACYCENFANLNVEFVSAYDLLTSEAKPNDISNYEQLIKLATKHGIDAKQLRDDLEYQIMSDYLLSNRDRHMNNIGFLRDSDTLKFISMAPIYDNGNSMFSGINIPRKLDKLEINSFVKKEVKILSYVTNPNLINIDKLLPIETIKELYLKDPNMDIDDINDICNAYKQKIELFNQRFKTH